VTEDIGVRRRLPRRVLVMLDAGRTLQAASADLRLMGHELHEAVDAPGAVELVCELLPDLLLVDIAPPAFEGLHVAQRIRQLNLATVPIIVAASVWNDAQVRVLADDAGIDVCITGPLDVAVIRRLLGSAPAGAPAENALSKVAGSIVAAEAHRGESPGSTRQAPAGSGAGGRGPLTSESKSAAVR
jgi:CheY-like chemotaxis protein